MRETLDPAEVDVPPTLALLIEGTSGWDPEAIQAAMGPAFGELATAIAELGAPVSGPPRTIYHSYGDGTARWTVAYPLSGPPARRSAGDVKVGELPAGAALRFTHVGPYERLSGTYGEITAWLIEQGHMQSETDWARFAPMWEEYIDDPETTPPERLRTHIFVPRPGA